MWFTVISTGSYDNCSKHERENNVKYFSNKWFELCDEKKTILIRLHTMKATKESCESTENFIDTHKERKIDKTKNDWDYLHA